MKDIACVIGFITNLFIFLKKICMYNIFGYTKQ